ncbi:hypothetical protein SAMN02746009_02959 [Hymenobacter psychrotolerans DSM 18569]|uniref:Uncharacterized protein n=1 Tax=Hymenobacter psychrotolerans DSM 18569 TaxID=1121959 RepID=A0A1M7BMM0_9BACT|nr:hypothetical protein SAMN02746009_02959 [Hymenobacter psychrotolerans DSM 18569]
MGDVGGAVGESLYQRTALRKVIFRLLPVATGAAREYNRQQLTEY